MDSQSYDVSLSALLAKQRGFVAAVLRNEFLTAILEGMRGNDLPEWYLSGGCLFQTVWNIEHGFEPAAGILDYDLFVLSDVYRSKVQRWSRVWPRLKIAQWPSDPSRRPLTRS